MKKWWALAAWLVLFGISVAGLIAQHPEPDNHKQPAKTERWNSPKAEPSPTIDAKPKQREGQEESNWVERILDKPVTDALLVLFTGLLAIYTRRLYQATAGLFTETAGLRTAADQQASDMQRSLRIAEEAAKAARRSADVAERALVDVQRALVVPVRFDVYTLTGGDKIVIGYRVVLSFENTGATAARRFTGAMNVLFLDGPLPDDFDFADREVAPAGSFVGPHVPVPYPIDIALQDITDIMNKKKRGFFYGWVEYDDIFNDTPKRRTEMCVELGVIAEIGLIVDVKGPAPISFTPYGKYNGTDEDCFYKPGRRPPVRTLPPIAQPPSKPAAQ